MTPRSTPEQGTPAPGSSTGTASTGPPPAPGSSTGTASTGPPPAPEAPKSFVDWGFAKATGRRLVAAGPKISPSEAAAEVAAIRAAADRARGPVAETARLHAPGDAQAPLVVDRPTWIDLNADSMGSLLGPVFAELMAKKPLGPSGATIAIGGKLTGAEVGALLAFMSSKVLGQYDLAPDGIPTLMLVAPNLVQVQRDLDLDAADFRLWVCMHEETHRVQFTAIPWLREHLITTARSLTSQMAPDPSKLAETLQGVLRRLPEAFGSGGAGLADLVATPEQRERLAAMTAIMSLLEGHADVVMDEVGPGIIPTVAAIRARFTERRQGAGTIDRMLRRLLGLEAKMRQYRDGAVFVRGVIDQVGVDDFNAIWTSPETLPHPAEIEDPAAWVRRVHG